MRFRSFSSFAFFSRICWCLFSSAFHSFSMVMFPRSVLRASFLSIPRNGRTSLMSLASVSISPKSRTAVWKVLKLSIISRKTEASMGLSFSSGFAFIELMKCTCEAMFWKKMFNPCFRVSAATFPRPSGTSLMHCRERLCVMAMSKALMNSVASLGGRARSSTRRPSSFTSPVRTASSTALRSPFSAGSFVKSYFIFLSSFSMDSSSSGGSSVFGRSFFCFLLSTPEGMIAMSCCRILDTRGRGSTSLSQNSSSLVAW
mmetsp:Transcript_3390/g.6695  ORF Transcript_3390/g.6695 Transcript_3390/m.6695 type:complete len:258 (+) Transcript_3390:19905-20678(+)